MASAQLQFTPRRTKQTEIELLRKQQYEYLSDYNEINPPPKGLAIAQELEERYRNRRSIGKSFYLLAAADIGTPFIIAIVFNHNTLQPSLEGLMPAFCLTAICLYVTGLWIRALANKSWLSQAADIRRPRPLETNVENRDFQDGENEYKIRLKYQCTWGLVNTQFDRALRESVDADIQKYLIESNQITHDDPRLFALTQTSEILKHEIEATILKSVCQVCHDFQPEVFRYEVLSVQKNPAARIDDDIIPVGTPSEYEGDNIAPVGIQTQQRPLSTYICGNPGNGKSSLIQEMVLQDIKRNQGVCVVDPTGDLMNIVVDYLPESRLDDVIYFDTSMPIALDFFSFKDDDEKTELIDDLAAMFNLDNAPIAQPFLIRILYTLFEANNNKKIYQPSEGIDHRCSFLDVSHFCTSETRRAQILSYCSEHRTEQFSRMPAYDTVNAIVSRMSKFVESHTLKTILGSHEPKLNIWDVMESNKILLVNLKDTPTDHFIASIIISKIQQATFRRRLIKDEHKRVPYYLYIDECNTVLKFAADHFEKILNRARKYKLGLVLANPTPRKLPDRILESLGTIGNLVIFNLDPDDSRIFKSRIAPYHVQFLTNLPKFHALFRTNNKITPIKTPTFLRPKSNSHADYIRTRTLRDYGPSTCKSAPVSHNSGDGNTDAPIPKEYPSEPPQKETGRPTIPPVRAQQDYSRHPRQKVYRKDDRSVPPGSKGSQ